MKEDGRFQSWLKDIVYINDQIDTDEAAAKIKNNIYFRGPNVWILAFSVIIASVGLNVNSTAVIIGAMLISPLMGPIMGIGLSLGTSDVRLLNGSFRNLLIMVVVSLLAASFYFLISPLNLVNPTELLARTRPTIYDVLIALFGGLAGILESCRKEKGTVMSGVAIATALMPPLCTAGYGIAKANPQYFLGAMLLFLINCVIELTLYLRGIYNAFKVIQFMAQRSCQKFLALDSDRIHVCVQSFHDHVVRTGHLSDLAGYGQTSFHTFLLTILLDDSGIDQYDRPLTDIDHDDPAKNSYLRSCQSDAFRVIHGLQHVVDQFLQSGSHFLYFPAFLCKDIITIYPDLS